jgi:hypothetical protein
MKRLPLLLIPLLLSSCQSTATKNASSFVQQIGAMNLNAADISQSTSTPFYSHSESAAGVATSPNGLSIINVKADVAIPLWGTTWSFSASSLTAGSNPPVVVPAK